MTNINPARTTAVAIIGFGAIGRFVAEKLPGIAGARLVCVLVRPARVAEVRRLLPAGAAPVVSDLPELVRLAPDLVLECAGHEAVQQYGEGGLEAGLDFAPISVGALATPGLLERLRAAAKRGRAKLILPAGAVAGIDAIRAARQGGLDSVEYLSRKPPAAWRGTPAEKLVDLEGLRAATVFYEGNAGEAARNYPQNANVAATVALAGLGLEATRVKLVADPSARGNRHEIRASGAFGRLEIAIEGKPLPGNPKTSTLAALSLLRLVENRAGEMEI
jgi:aspartate dehydrogenase